MFERMRRAAAARQADALAEIHMPVSIPGLLAPPGSGAAGRCAELDREIAAMLERDHGVVLDAGTTPGLDALIDARGARWVSEDDREFAEYVGRLRRRLGQVESILAAAELAHRRCERGWTYADRDYLAARTRLGAPDPSALPSPDEPDEAFGSVPAARRRSAAPFVRFDAPRRMP